MNPVIKKCHFSDMNTACHFLDYKDQSYFNNNQLDNTKTGIFIEQSYNSEKYFEIKNNIFNDNRIAIWTVNTSNKINPSLIQNNNINFWVTPLSQTYGIRIQNCHYVQVKSNYITNNGSLPSNTNNKLTVRGIDVSSTLFAKIRDNQITHTGIGFRITGSCKYTQFYCNYLTNCYKGFYFDTQACITDQGSSSYPTGNYWIGNYGPNGENKMDKSNSTNFLPGQQKYWCQNVLVQNPQITQWHPLYTNIVVKYTLSQLPCSTFPQLLSPEPERDELWLDVAMNSLTYPLNQEESRYQDMKNLYAYLVSDSSQISLGLPTDSVYRQFLDTVALTQIPTVYRMQQSLANGDYETAATENEYFEPDPVIIEENINIVNEIFLRTTAQDQFDWQQEDMDALQSVAYQLPYTGGEAVYTARVMLGIDPDDYEISYRKANPDKIKLNNLISVYPVPAKDELIIEFLQAVDHNTLLIRFFDLTGRLVTEKQIVSDNKKISVSVEDIENGIYMLSVTGNNILPQSVKIIINK